jgi:hypothetical protein
MSVEIREPTTNPICTAMVNQAELPGERVHFSRSCGNTDVAENQVDMDRISVSDKKISVRDRFLLNSRETSCFIFKSLIEICSNET